MIDREHVSIFRRLLHRVGVSVGALSLALAFFLVLPLIQAINKPPTSALALQSVDSVNLPPPPPPPPEDEPEEEEPEEQPPELMEEAPPLDLSQLELVLNPGFSGDWLGGDFAVNLQTVASDDEVKALFSSADLDQPPRCIHQPGPTLTTKLRRKAPGSVQVIFVVNERGRVENPIVQSSSDPIFERPALAAVKQWRFEPGKRSGEPVQFRMRVPITFAKGR